jgi:hypothetical protein
MKNEECRMHTAHDEWGGTMGGVGRMRTAAVRVESRKQEFWIADSQ